MAELVAERLCGLQLPAPFFSVVNIGRVVQWIERGASDSLMGVRFFPCSQCMNIWRNWIAHLITD